MLTFVNVVVRVHGREERARRLLNLLCIAIGLSLAWIGSAQAQHNITILRGIDANTNNGYASMPPGQFAFNQTLSNGA